MVILVSMCNSNTLTLTGGSLANAFRYAIVCYVAVPTQGLAQVNHTELESQILCGHI